MNHRVGANLLFYAGPVSIIDVITERSNVSVDSHAHNNIPRQSILSEHFIMSDILSHLNKNERIYPAVTDRGSITGHGLQYTLCLNSFKVGSEEYK